MAGKPAHEYPADEVIAEAVRTLGLPAAYQQFVDQGYKFKLATLRSHCLGRGLPTRADVKPPGDPGVKDNDDGTKTLTGKPGILDSPEALLESFGIDPDQWKIVRVRANTWGNPPQPQLRVDVVPLELLIQPPEPSDWKPPPKPRKPTKEKPLKGFVISDHHAPHNEKVFHKLTLAYLADEQPDIIEVNGDLGDYPTASRHRERDGYASPVNECLSGSYGILRDYRHTCPDATIRFKKGNHEARLEHLILDNARALHKIAPAEEDLPALSLQRLLRLDELGVEYVDEDWDHAKTKLTNKLTVRHGFSVSPNAGKIMLDKLSGSTIQGHDHRLAMTFRTEYDQDERMTIRMAMSGGCACVIPGGLGYVAGGQPNWANAFAAVTIWPDGDFLAAPGIYANGRLLAPNGKRYA